MSSAPGFGGMTEPGAIFFIPLALHGTSYCAVAVLTKENDMESNTEADLTAGHEEQYIRAVTYITPDVYSWLQKQVKAMSDVGQRTSVSEVMRDCINYGAQRLESQVNTIVELRTRGVRT